MDMSGLQAIPYPPPKKKTLQGGLLGPPRTVLSIQYKCVERQSVFLVLGFSLAGTEFSIKVLCNQVGTIHLYPSYVYNLVLDCS